MRYYLWKEYEVDISHPDWCVGTEGVGEDHMSATVHAAVPTDGADIRLRLEELRHDGGRTTMLFLEIMEDDEVYSCPLLIPQARLLRERLGQLVP